MYLDDTHSKVRLDVGQSSPTDVPETIAQTLQRALSSPKLIVTAAF